MVKFVKTHPLLSVLLAASAVRLMAVIWSQGFIHSDDHFDTVAVAWHWLQDGLWGNDGYLHWKNNLASTIGRFPLYNLTLLAQMKLCQSAGMVSLSSMMYVVRGSHALLSLLPVWATYTVVKQVSSSDRWAVIGGLAAGFHFAFPFLGTRNLIEVVGGNIWMVAICCLYFYRRRPELKWLYLAGLLAGLAWMIRFQLAFALLPIPLILWWETRQIRPVVHFSVAAGAMLLVSALVDWWLLGRFAGSTLAYLSMNVGYGALYETIPLLYPLLLLLLLVPPFSLVLIYAAGRPGFVKKHLILFGSCASFIIIHWLLPHQQERFILPILPAVLMLSILAIWQWSRDAEEPVLGRSWRRWMLGASVAINLALLTVTTFAYGHRGMIEPLKWFEANDPTARVLVFQPEVKRWMPYAYGGPALSHTHVRKWHELPVVANRSSTQAAFDYFVIYPKNDNDLPVYLDSLQIYFGRLEPFFEVTPSMYDQVLRRLNMNHNDNFACYTYRPAAPAVSDIISRANR